MTRVTTTRARELDRAMGLLHEGKISYGRWVETLEAWARGESVRGWDYGEAESMPDRIVVLFAGREVTTREVAAHFQVPVCTACQALRRLATKRRIQKLALGLWRVGHADTKGKG